MAQDTSKRTLGDIFRWCNGQLNSAVSAAEMAAGTAPTHWETFEFIDNVNTIAAKLALFVEYLMRFYVVRADTGMMRYEKFTRSEGSGNIFRYDLDGQTATLPSGIAVDVECTGAQYEKSCDGDGVDINPAGVSATPTAPDTFPKIYLPADCDLEPADLLSGNPLVYNPLARIRSSSGRDNYPRTSGIVDIEYVGFGSADTTSDHYPTSGSQSSFFVDPYLIAALELITVTYGAIAVVGANLIPRDDDAYLDDTWATNWGVTGAFVGAALTGAPDTYTIDGITYTVAVVAGVTGDFGFTITDDTAALSTWRYEITSTDTPWQTVVQGNDGAGGVHRWGNLFSATQDHAWYLKFDDQRIKLPDDIEKIEWVMKIPKNSYYDDIQPDADDANELKSIGDNLVALWNPIDYTNHYYPVTHTIFTRARAQWLQNTINSYAGIYMQQGQQIRIEPKTTDPILIQARCKPDLADTTLTIDEFDDVYLEIPSIAIDCIQYMLLADYYLGKAGDSNASDRWMAKYLESRQELKSDFKGKMGQNEDGSPLTERLPPKDGGISFGYNILPRPTRRFGDR